jgi:hypothetical protein
MKINLASEIEKDIEVIEDMLIALGFDYLDDRVLEYLSFVGDEDFTIYLQPEILTYTRGGKGVPIETRYEVWIGCSVEGDNVEKLAVTLKEILKKATIKPFKDEDAFIGIFSKKDDHEMVCYFNPDYPEGYWQNHVL